MNGNFDENAVVTQDTENAEGTQNAESSPAPAPAPAKQAKTAREKKTPAMNIFQKMLAVENALATVAKNLDVGFGKNKYKAVSERDIIDAVKPLEAEYGIYSYPYSREVVESRTTDKTKDDGNVITTYMTRIKTVYRFVNVDNPEEFIETTVFSEGIDTQDKGSGKAMTYGDKYALMKAYKISTGDDPDAVASPDPEAPGDAPKPTKTWGSAKTTTPAPAKKDSAPAAWGTPPAQQTQQDEQKQNSGWGSGWKKSS